MTSHVFVNKLRASVFRCVAMMARNKLFNMLLGEFIDSKTYHG